MKISAIQSNLTNETKSSTTKFPTFGAKLNIHHSLQNRMNQDVIFRDVMNRFSGWLSGQQPKDGIVSITSKAGKLVEQIDYSRPAISNIPFITWCREDLELSMGDKKTGFYFNPKNWEDNILNDLKRVFETIK